MFLFCVYVCYLVFIFLCLHLFHTWTIVVFVFILWLSLRLLFCVCYLVFIFHVFQFKLKFITWIIVSFIVFTKAVVLSWEYLKLLNNFFHCSIIPIFILHVFNALESDAINKYNGILVTENNDKNIKSWFCCIHGFMFWVWTQIYSFEFIHHLVYHSFIQISFFSFNSNLFLTWIMHEKFSLISPTNVISQINLIR